MATIKFSCNTKCAELQSYPQPIPHSLKVIPNNHVPLGHPSQPYYSTICPNMSRLSSPVGPQPGPQWTTSARRSRPLSLPPPPRAASPGILSMLSTSSIFSMSMLEEHECVCPMSSTTSAASNSSQEGPDKDQDDGEINKRGTTTTGRQRQRKRGGNERTPRTVASSRGRRDDQDQTSTTTMGTRMRTTTTR